jgi:hypothetical protein
LYCSIIKIDEIIKGQSIKFFYYFDEYETN